MKTRKSKTFYEDAKRKITKEQLIDEIYNCKNFEYIANKYDIKSKFISKMCKEYNIIKQKENRVCIICGGVYKPYKIKGETYCYKHYQQLKQCGKILERTKFDFNEFVIHKDFAEIIIYNKDCNEIARTLIDKEDVEIVKNIKWYITKTGYICNGKTKTKLHHFILNIKNTSVIIVDHVNRNKLDNRKCNLRLVNNTENSINRTKALNKSSNYIGVSYNKEKNKWESYIKVDKKQIKLGYYINIEDALIARLRAEKQYFGDFSPQKNLLEIYKI